MLEPEITILSKNEILREGLRRILEHRGFQVVQTVSLMSEVDDDLVHDGIFLIDGNLLDTELATCKCLRERFPDIHIVLMMDNYSIEDVTGAFASGSVDGYLVKAISCEPLAGALRLIAMGEKVLPSQVADSLCNSLSTMASRGWSARCTGANLSNREVEILRCLLDGDSNKLISRRLSIADATVKVHIKAILRKLRVKNRTQAAIWAVERGLTIEQPRLAASPAILPLPSLSAVPTQTVQATLAAI